MGLPVEQAKNNLTDARAKYADALGRWDSGRRGLRLDAVSAMAQLADRGEGRSPDGTGAHRCGVVPEGDRGISDGGRGSQLMMQGQAAWRRD